MRRAVLFSVWWLLMAVALAPAVENGPLKVTIVSAEQKTHDRIIYWEVDTPLYREDPYFIVTVRAARTLLVGEYEPRHDWESLPQMWKPGAMVEARIDKRAMYLKRPNGTELRFAIVKRTTERAEPESSPQ
jgi:hypothetical protein